MDDEPMLATNRVGALTLGPTITIPETANEFAIKGQKPKPSLKKIVASADEGNVNFDADKIMARMDVMTIKMDAQYKEIQSRARCNHCGGSQSISYCNDDDTPMSYEEEAKIMKTFRHFDALLGEGIQILYSNEGTPLEDKIFAEFDEFIAMNVEENSKYESNEEEPTFEKITFNTKYKIKTSLEEPPADPELRQLPDHPEYTFFKKPSFLHVISSQLSEQNKNKLVYLLKRHKQAFAWKTTYIHESVEVFMDDFSVFGKSFDDCIHNLDTMLQRCKDANLVLNLEKCHFMVKEGIVLGHKVSGAGLEVDKAKIDVISKLSPPTNVEGIRRTFH
ncbi:hypothetical protein Tco_1245797 [Tanacetum coccineum]